MIDQVIGKNIAIVGGGNFCLKFIRFLLETSHGPLAQVLGIADMNEHADGICHARRHDILTTGDYTRLYSLEGLDTLLELTNDPDMAETIRKTMPAYITLIDHFAARALWDALQVADVRHRTLDRLNHVGTDHAELIRIFEAFADQLSNVLTQRNKRSYEIEMELVKQERTRTQIIHGSTIPTFVINHNHEVTHWNRALEKLSGYRAEQIVGTNRQWAPFWPNERPTMADVILSRCDESQIKKLYGATWRRSALVDGGYEAEVFFPSLGGSGKWCFFTAAPIQDPGGRIVGAIETLQDVTEDKRAKQAMAEHAHELQALCSIYSALNSHAGLDDRIQNAISEIRRFLSADSICIYLQKEERTFHLRYCDGNAESIDARPILPEPASLIQRCADSGKPVIFSDLSAEDHPEIKNLLRTGLQSVAYVPISAKEKRSLGVLRVGSRNAAHFTQDKRSLLELLSNRIGITIENAMLQDQFIKSEEKYKSLFNNDPNPIFILDSRTFQILDINQRAQDCYGYSREGMLTKNFLDIGDADDDLIKTGLSRLLTRQSVLFSKKRHYRKDGSPFYVNINVSHAPYGQDHVLIATTTDISETVEKETQLIQAGKMTTLGVMAAGMAHEINQPLNVIQICADFFLKMLNRQQPIDEADLRSMATDIVDNVARAAGVIKHVRDFARQSDVVRSRVDINAPLTDVFKVLGHQLKVHEIERVLDLDPKIACIMADHNRLEQVFINLVTNAIDAMDEKQERGQYKDEAKRLTIRTFMEDGQVAVDIADTGIGMSEEIKNKIFEPFFTTKKIGKGTGLGISISYGIVRDYDGTIAIDSQAGCGTVFKLRFPAMPSGAEGQPA